LADLFSSDPDIDN
jgi:hypothetical protein